MQIIEAKICEEFKKKGKKFQNYLAARRNSNFNKKNFPKK